MDYSASINDTEHPAGDSPWGNSPVPSPQANRTTFGAASGGPPSSPPVFGSPQISGNGFGPEHDDDGGFGSPEQPYGARPGTASTVSEGDAHTTETAIGDAPAGEQQQQQVGFHDENVSPSHQGHDPRLSGDTARASREQPPQPRKPAQPQYKLQAKITGLERAARKDPILRFDVHVSY